MVDDVGSGLDTSTVMKLPSCFSSVTTTSESVDKAVRSVMSITIFMFIL